MIDLNEIFHDLSEREWELIKDLPTEIILQS